MAIKDATPFLEAIKRQKSIFVYGHIDYRDIYDHNHKTNYCYELEVLDNGVLKLIPASDHQDVQ